MLNMNWSPVRRFVVAFFFGLLLGACESHATTSSADGAALDARIGDAKALGAGGGGSSGSGGAGASGAGGAQSSGGAGGASGPAPACVATRTFSCPDLGSGEVLANLPQGDRGTFCDCLAAFEGGYGVQSDCTCPDGSSGNVLSAEASQSSCVSSLLSIPSDCTVTVDEFNTCVNLLWARPCDDGAIASAILNPACKHMLTRPCPWAN